MSGSLSTILAETPSSSDGIATRYGNWLFIVQIAVPDSAGATWDDDTWDDDDWSAGWQWQGVKAAFRGCSWDRGRAGIQNRPETSAAFLTLSNSDGALSFWNAGSTFTNAPWTLAPGTLVRFGWYDSAAGDWEPAYAGILDEAEEEAAERDGDLWTTWSLIETTGILSLIDQDAQDELGSGETTSARLTRLLNDAQWPFGTNYATLDSPFASDTLQATTLAGNRLSEIYLTADSGFGDAFSDRQGRMRLISKALATTRWAVHAGSPVYGVSESGGTAGGVRYVPWAAAPRIRTSNIDRYDSVTAGRANGGSQSAIGGGDLPFPSYYRRTDLLMDSDTNLLPWAQAWITAFAGNVVKFDALELDPNQDSNVIDAIAHLDAPARAWVKRTNPRQTSGYTDTTFDCLITGYHVDVQPQGTTAAMSIHATLTVAVVSYS